MLTKFEAQLAAALRQPPVLAAVVHPEGCSCSRSASRFLLRRSSSIAAGVAAATGAGDEAAFRRLVVLLGAARSEELLSDVRSRLPEALYAGN
ncbi:MAG: hypothetical protein U0165_06825 [Polyangiaceae bacterium]